MLPMVKAVLAKLWVSIGYKGQASSLLEMFKAHGFRWRKMRDLFSSRKKVMRKKLLTFNGQQENVPVI
jgi:hypothetical protein